VVAFANTNGGQIFIGVNENGEISGAAIGEETVQKWVNEVKQNTRPQVVPFAEVFKIGQKTIAVLNIIEYPIKPVAYKDKYYKRVLNSNHKLSLTEVANEHLRTINGSWDYYADPNHSLEHISIKKIEKYIKEYELSNDVTVNYEPLTFIMKQEILKEGQLTFGAYLLFAKELCTVSDVQVGRFKGNTIFKEKLNGGLNGGLNESQNITFEKIKERPGIKAKELSEILNVPIDTLDKHIKILVIKSLIERKGSKKTGGYFVK
jgi:ATP-dependent DNA helicase RecG